MRAWTADPQGAYKGYKITDEEKERYWSDESRRADLIAMVVELACGHPAVLIDEEGDVLYYSHAGIAN